MDSVGRKLDRIFVGVDSAVKVASRTVDNVKHARKQIETVADNARAAVAPRHKIPVQVTEAIDGQTGRPSYVVAVGDQRAECSSRAFADAIAAALRARGAR